MEKGCECKNSEKVQCCICEKTINKESTLIPSGCLNMHGKTGHRICQECWWNPTTGFAMEGQSHKCPGCLKGSPLTQYKKDTPIIIDLTEDC